MTLKYASTRSSICKPLLPVHHVEHRGQIGADLAEPQKPERPMAVAGPPRTSAPTKPALRHMLRTLPNPLRPPLELWYPPMDVAHPAPAARPRLFRPVKRLEHVRRGSRCVFELPSPRARAFLVGPHLREATHPQREGLP